MTVHVCVCVEVVSSIKENRQTSTVLTVHCALVHVAINFVDWVSSVDRWF